MDVVTGELPMSMSISPRSTMEVWVALFVHFDYRYANVAQIPVSVNASFSGVHADIVMQSCVAETEFDLEVQVRCSSNDECIACSRVHAVVCRQGGCSVDI